MERKKRVGALSKLLSCTASVLFVCVGSAAFGGGVVTIDDGDAWGDINGDQNGITWTTMGTASGATLYDVHFGANIYKIEWPFANNLSPTSNLVYYNLIGADLGPDGTPQTHIVLNEIPGQPFICPFFNALPTNYSISTITRMSLSGFYLNTCSPSSNGSVILLADNIIHGIYDSVFHHNSVSAWYASGISAMADGNGGALCIYNTIGSDFPYISTSSDPILYSSFLGGNVCNTTFYSNSAGQSGGAIWVRTLIGGLHNCGFYGNIAESNGGAMYIEHWKCPKASLDNAYRLGVQGDTLFLHNKARGSTPNYGMLAPFPGKGGALYISLYADIYAAFGDLVFQGNMDHASYGGNPNAIYFENLNSSILYSGNNTLAFHSWFVWQSSDYHSTISLSALEGRTIRFYDPISSNEYLRNLTFRINGAPAEDDESGFPNACGIGEWAKKQTGTVLFDTHASDVYFSKVIVCSGTMALHNGASFGAKDNIHNIMYGINVDSKFIVKNEATLRIAYEQEKREYILGEDGNFDRSDPSKIALSYPEYSHAHISAINASKIIVRGAINFVLPSTAANGDILLTTPAAVIFKEDGRIALGAAFPKTPLRINDKIVLIKSDSGVFRKRGHDALVNYPFQSQSVTIEQPISFATSTFLRYTFDVYAENNNLIATLSDIAQAGRTGVNPDSCAFTNSHLAGFLVANRGTEIAATLAAKAESSLCRCEECKCVNYDTKKLPCKNAAKKASWTPFLLPASTNCCTYETGATSTARTRSISFVGGAFNDAKLALGRLHFGEFLECGIDHFRSCNDFAESDFGEAGTVRGKGHSNCYTAGTVLRVDFDGTACGHGYCEGSCRMGAISTDWESSDFLGRTDNYVDYKISNFFCGGHFGLGYALHNDQGWVVDFGSKCLWSHRASGHVVLRGEDALSFDAVNSVIVKLGVSVSTSIGRGFSARFTTALERELDGESRATICGYDVPASTLRGGSAVGKLQFTWVPEFQRNLVIKLGVCGHVGAREGVSAQFQVAYSL
ncbi:MAG: hypothetical protein LBC42_00520 [Puniceicoccales bacterium]|jgi:hypothetical protein|nr:hypothetical protein [Puniceicoccales bacterium]